MRPVLNAHQIRQWDQYTIDREPISSLGLMERAAQAFVTIVEPIIRGKENVHIVCGNGNNGGDGLVIGRLLSQKFKNVRLSILQIDQEGSPDFQQNLRRLPQRQNLIVEHFAPENITQFSLFHETVLIDALFGTGLTRPISAPWDAIIDQMNQFRGITIAVDIPSGLPAQGPPIGPAVKADYTLSFEVPKRSFMLPESLKYIGQIRLCPIGLLTDFPLLNEISDHLIEATDVAQLLKARSPQGHKYTFGRTAIVAGSKGMAGAAVLAGLAAYRIGTGFVGLISTEDNRQILQTSVTEALFFPREPDVIDQLPWASVGVGSGCGQTDDFVSFFEKLLDQVGCPLVIDADAITTIAGLPDLEEKLPQNSIITPHSGEADRWLGISANHEERIKKCRKKAQEKNLVIVLKGPHTAICLPNGHVYYNDSGNAALAKAGSGDVLTGMLTGLLAQNYSAVDATVIAVFIHGYCGDLWIRKNHMSSLLARDIIELIPTALRTLENKLVHP